MKRPNIKIKTEEINQALDYKIFIQKHYKLDKVTTFLMSDRYDMDPIVRTTANSLEKSGDLFIRSYSDLLRDAKKFNQEFINKYEEIKEVYDKFDLIKYERRYGYAKYSRCVSGAGGLTEGFRYKDYYNFICHIEMDKDACSSLELRNIYY